MRKLDQDEVSGLFSSFLDKLMNLCGDHEILLKVVDGKISIFKSEGGVEMSDHKDGDDFSVEFHECARGQRRI